MRTKALLVGLGMLLWLCAAGCIFSPDEEDGGGGPPPTPPLPFPDSEDQLMANFKTIYEAMDINEYGKILDTNYRFKYQPFDVESLNLPGEFHNRDDELGIMRNIFSQNAIVNSQGQRQEAITEITVRVLDPVSIWEDSTDPDFPDSRKRLYTVNLEFKRPEDTTIIVQGSQEFYVSSRDSLHNGIPKLYWQLVGQIDLTEHTP